MNIIDNLKGSIKATLDAVTGHGAIVELETEGAPAPFAKIEVKITVSGTGRNVDFKSAVIDLHGQDDLDESALEAMREFLVDRDPHYSFEVHGPFHVAADGKTYLHGSFEMPGNADAKRKWLARARVKHTGVDPRSKYLLME